MDYHTIEVRPCLEKENRCTTLFSKQSLESRLFGFVPLPKDATRGKLGDQNIAKKRPSNLAGCCDIDQRRRRKAASPIRPVTRRYMCQGCELDYTITLEVVSCHQCKADITPESALLAFCEGPVCQSDNRLFLCQSCHDGNSDIADKDSRKRCRGDSSEGSASAKALSKGKKIRKEPDSDSSLVIEEFPSESLRSVDGNESDSTVGSRSLIIDEDTSDASQAPSPDLVAKARAIVISSDLYKNKAVFVCNQFISHGCDELLHSFRSLKSHLAKAHGISGDVVPCKDNPFYPLLLRSSIAQQVEVIIAVLKLQRWYRFSVVTSEMPGHRLFQKTLRDKVANFKENEEKGVWSIYRTFTLNVHPTSSVQDVKAQLVGRNMSQVVLLYCSKKEAKTIFQAAGALGYTSEDFVWIAAESVIGDFTKLREAPPQYPVGLLSLVSQSQKYNKEATIRTGVLLYMEALRQYIQDGNSVSDLQTYNCRNIRGTRSSNATKLLYRYLTSTTIEDLDIKFNEDGTTTISTFDIMNVDGRKLWERVGSWNKDSLYMEGVTWPGNKASPPNGISKDKHIRIVAVLEHPFITATEPDITGECHNTVECKKINRTARGGIKMCCTGFCIDLLKELARDVMFSYDLYLVPDNKHGKYEKGKWTGCIGELVKGHAQMALGSITITKERATVVDFSMPFVETGISVMTRRRKGVVPATAFLEPFDVFAWMAMFAVCLSCVAFTVMAFEFFSPEGYAGNLHPSAGRFTVGKAFWLLWALIFNNSVPVENPRGATSKYMITFWAFFAVIFLATYTANLAAFMIQEEYTEAITGLTDEKFSNPYAHSFRFGTKPNGSTEAFIAKNFRRMHEYMNRYNQPSVNAAITALKGGTLDAFIYDAAVLNYEAGKDEGCQLRTIAHGNVFATTGYGIGFPKNSEWVDDIDLALLSYFANGKVCYGYI
uniref:Glutamate receptor n=1 Tax=Branchiostoma floridae TaxID=7739 RepID=C3Y747_BRAFL|eukprot:XP_002608147.1 hypothetical protein BRAFLDRAFT_91374 [Branchiostoma floridae]